MAKLYFRYGAMGSAKTLNLLAVAHNYRQQGKRVLLLKPELDRRFNPTAIRSRAGLEQKADLLVNADTQISEHQLVGINCILVDEAHFLNSSFIEHLRDIACFRGIPVICYGLRTDFRSNLFEASKRLMELADSIEELKSTCTFCDRKAIMSLRHVDGVATTAGPVIELGAEDKYFPTCYSCYRAELAAAGESVEPRQTTNLKSAANC